MASAAAAAVARARRDIQHHFFSKDAVRPDRAIAFEPSRRIERRLFERMMSRGIIRQVKQGRYWLDVVAYDEDLTSRYGRVKIALWIVILAFLVAALIPIVRQ
jgi:hypothetical protein